MTLKQHIEYVEELVKNNPEVLELEVVYAIDDEGNDYKLVSFKPSILELQESFNGTKLIKPETKVVCIN